MEIISTYSVRIKENSHIYSQSIELYRGAVDFYIGIMMNHWNRFLSLTSTKEAVLIAESMTVKTAKRPEVLYDFGVGFYKFPSYLRRSAISEAFGKVCSYKSNLENWEQADSRHRGEKPGVPKAGMTYPVLYRGNCYKRENEYRASIKVFIRNTWDWITVQLRKSDVDYIRHHCQQREECSPTLQKRGRRWYLDFPFKEEVKLRNKTAKKQTIISVDLGINCACTCVCMQSDGTVLGRHFLHLPGEYDSLNRRLSHIRRAQHHGARKISTLWKFADGINHDIAVKTALFIVDTAIRYRADCIVFEHLDLVGKKHGPQKFRLHLWKARCVQKMVIDKAHRYGMRVSHICAWGTSRLAYDGSGPVKRGNESDKTKKSYSICQFTTGKIYNCDLNAAYNIGARYFVRELLKTLPVTDGQRIAAKVPGCAKRSTSTLSTLISLNAELYAAA